MSYISEIVCNDCKVNTIKDPECSGDYDEDGNLLSFCPICGYMYPVLSAKEVNLSNRERKNIGVRIAKRYRLDYKKMRSLVGETKETNLNGFVKILSERISEEFDINIKTKNIFIVYEGKTDS